MQPGAATAWPTCSTRTWVAAVLTGHAPTAAATTFAARPLFVGPAITWTLRMH